MGFFGDFGSTIVRGLADVATFGTNELLGNPAGNLYSSIVDPHDPNAAANAQSYALAQQNIALQKEFAQKGIQWRVADAQAAGLHPLAALGSSGASFSPVSAAFLGEDTGTRDFGRNALFSMGQDLIRSRAAAATPSQRAAEALTLKRGELENDLLETQVANAKLELAKHAAVPPRPEVPGTTQLMRTANGQLVVVPSNEFAQANAGSILGNAGWWLENKAVPFVTGGFGQWPRKVVEQGVEYGFWPIANRYIPMGRK